MVHRITVQESPLKVDISNDNLSLEASHIVVDQASRPSIQHTPASFLTPGPPPPSKEPSLFEKVVNAPSQTSLHTSPHHKTICCIPLVNHRTHKSRNSSSKQSRFRRPRKKTISHLTECRDLSRPTFTAVLPLDPNNQLNSFTSNLNNNQIFPDFETVGVQIKRPSLPRANKVSFLGHFEPSLPGLLITFCMII